jgi:hypothetical protein
MYGSFAGHGVLLCSKTVKSTGYGGIQPSTQHSGAEYRRFFRLKPSDLRKSYPFFHGVSFGKRKKV